MDARLKGSAATGEDVDASPLVESRGGEVESGRGEEIASPISDKQVESQVGRTKQRVYEKRLVQNVAPRPKASVIAANDPPGGAGTDRR